MMRAYTRYPNGTLMVAAVPPDARMTIEEIRIGMLSLYQTTTRNMKPTHAILVRVK